MKPIYNTTVRFTYKNVSFEVKNVPCSLTKTEAMLSEDFIKRVLRLHGKERHMSKDAIVKLQQDAPKVKITKLIFNDQIGVTNDK